MHIHEPASCIRHSVSLFSSDFMKGIAKRFLNYEEVDTLGSRGKVFSLEGGGN